jgi:preprotein translocase subunit SecA
MAGRGVDILLGGNPEGLAQQHVLREGFAPDTLADEADLLLPLAQMSDEYRASRVAAKARYDELVKSYKVSCQEEGDKVRSLGGMFLAPSATSRGESIINCVVVQAVRETRAKAASISASMTN